MTVYCLTHRKQAVATADHLGRLTCSLCGEPIQPIVFKQKAPA